MIEMTYEEFLNIPVNVFKDLQTILILKCKYGMDITPQEKKIYEHMERLYNEQVKSAELLEQKSQLEKLFKL